MKNTSSDEVQFGWSHPCLCHMSGRGRELYGIWATTICWTWRGMLKLWHCMIQVLFGSNLSMINTKHPCFVTHTYTLYQNSSNGYWVNGTDPWQKHNVCKPCGSIQNSKQECGMNKQSHKQHLRKIYNSNDTELLGMLTVVVSEMLHITLWAWVSSRLFHSLRQSSPEIASWSPTPVQAADEVKKCPAQWVTFVQHVCLSFFILQRSVVHEASTAISHARATTVAEVLGYAGLCLMLKP